MNIISEVRNIGGVDYAWVQNGSRQSFRPVEQDKSKDAFGIVQKTMEASDGSQFKAPMSTAYIKDIRSRKSNKDYKFKNAGQFGADIRG